MTAPSGAIRPARRRLVALLTGLALAGCDRPEYPPGGDWVASCSASPYALTMSFTGEGPDGAGGDRQRLAQLAVPLDATGLADLYVMDVGYEAGAEYDPWVGVAWTEWFEHAPMPASMIDAWELEPLHVDLERYSLGGEAAQAQAGCQDPQGHCDYWRLEGTCTWGGEPGEFIASAVVPDGCATAGGSGVGAAAAAGALLVVATRRRRARPTPAGPRLLRWGAVLLGVGGCAPPTGIWLGRLGDDARFELQVPEQGEDFLPGGRVWLLSRPNDVLAYNCPDHGSGLGRFRGKACVGLWTAGEETTAFAFEARRVRDGDLEFLEGTVTWQGDEDVGADATLSLLRVGPPPTSAVPGAPAGGVTEDGTDPSDTGPTDTGAGPTDTGTSGAAR